MRRVWSSNALDSPKGFGPTFQPTQFSLKEFMITTPSPIEHLVTNAIVFIAGAVTLSLVAAYGQWMKHKGALSR